MTSTEGLGDEDIECYCPECKKLVTMEAGHEVGCELCGEHSAVQCQSCLESFDHVWGYDDIEAYNKDK